MTAPGRFPTGRKPANSGHSAVRGYAGARDLLGSLSGKPELKRQEDPGITERGPEGDAGRRPAARWPVFT